MFDFLICCNKTRTKYGTLALISFVKHILNNYERDEV